MRTSTSTPCRVFALLLQSGLVELRASRTKPKLSVSKLTIPSKTPKSILYPPTILVQACFVSGRLLGYTRYARFWGKFRQHIDFSKQSITELNPKNTAKALDSKWRAKNL